MLGVGVRASVTCVDPRQIPAALARRSGDERFLNDLPASADPCGERREFHMFVPADPMFRAPIPVTVGEVIERDGFVFADLLPQQPS